MDKYDIILEDRREYIEEKKIPICPDNCLLDGFNPDTMEVLCYCPENINLNKTSFGLIYKKFKFLNFHVLSCYKKIDLKLFFPVICIIIFILNIILIIFTEIYIYMKI